MTVEAKPLVHSTSDSLRYVCLSTFTFLAALTLRDSFTAIWRYGFRYTDLEKDGRWWKIMVLQMVLAIVVVGLALCISVYWVNHGTFSLN